MAQAFSVASQAIVDNATSSGNAGSAGDFAYDSAGGRISIVGNTSGFETGRVWALNTLDGLDISGVSDFELYIEVEHGSSANSFLCASVTNIGAGYRHIFAYGREGNDLQQIVFAEGNQLTGLASDNISSITHTQRIRKRFRRDGQEYKLKVWQAGEIEPTLWGLTATSSLGDDLMQPSISQIKSSTASVYAVGIGTDGDPAPTGPVASAAIDANAVTRQAQQGASADVRIIRRLNASTLQALQAVAADLSQVRTTEVQTAQASQRASAAAEIVGVLTVEAVTRQLQQGTSAGVGVGRLADVFTRQQGQRTSVEAEIVGVITAAIAGRQAAQRTSANLSATTSVSSQTVQARQRTNAEGLVTAILNVATSQMAQGARAAFGDLVRARIVDTSISKAQLTTEIRGL